MLCTRLFRVCSSVIEHQSYNPASLLRIVIIIGDYISMYMIVYDIMIVPCDSSYVLG